MKAVIVSPLVLLLLAGPPLAVNTAQIEARYTPAFRQSLDSPEGQSTMGMVQCIGAELEIRDAALNVGYRGLIGDMTTDQKAGLQKAQRAWNALRDADCQSRYSPDWGSMSTITADMSMLQKTVERTIELEIFDPDLSAPAEGDDDSPTVGLILLRP